MVGTVLSSTPRIVRETVEGGKKETKIRSVRAFPSCWNPISFEPRVARCVKRSGCLLPFVVCRGFQLRRPIGMHERSGVQSC